MSLTTSTMIFLPAIGCAGTEGLSPPPHIRQLKVRLRSDERDDGEDGGEAVRPPRRPRRPGAVIEE